jgi:uncharacterized protein (TIGR02246 family)
MNARAAISTLILLLACTACATAGRQNSADEGAIRKAAERWHEAWNAHDMNAMGALLTDDADFINVAGLHWKGKPEIVREHALRHRTNLKDSVWVTREVAIQPLAPELALVHVKWGMTGDTDFDGTPRKPRDGIFTWLMERRDGAWLIRAVQNTNLAASPAQPVRKP